MEYLKYLYIENDAELSKEFGDVFRILLPSKLTAVEAPEINVQAEDLITQDSALPRKVRRGGKFKIQKS